MKGFILIALVLTVSTAVFATDYEFDAKQVSKRGCEGLNTVMQYRGNFTLKELEGDKVELIAAKNGAVHTGVKIPSGFRVEFKTRDPFCEFTMASMVTDEKLGTVLSSICNQGGKSSHCVITYFGSAKIASGI